MTIDAFLLFWNEFWATPLSAQAIITFGFIALVIVFCVNKFFD